MTRTGFQFLRVLIDRAKFLFAGVLFVSALPAQIDTQGAQVISYFPQLADGGAPSQKWTTRLIFSNVHMWYPAVAVARLFDDDGNPLALDFGNGPVSSFDFTVPPNGSVTFESTGASASTVVGWARVASSLPLQGVVQFQYSTDGNPVQGVSAQATLAATAFQSPATSNTGLAIANPSSDPLTVGVFALDQDGYVIDESSLTIPGGGHKSIGLSQVISTLPSTFRGTVFLSGDDPFVVWTLSGEGGVLSSYPPSAFEWPASQYERTMKVWFKLLNVVEDYFGLDPLPMTVVSGSPAQISSSAVAAANEVHLSTTLPELFADSDSELAFALGHELAHLIQAEYGVGLVPADVEVDADQWAMVLSMEAGYDPYGAAGALAKLAMASSTTGLVDPNFDNLAASAAGTHGSFNNRLALVFKNMQEVCSDPDAASSCEFYKSLFHPGLPSATPLMKEGRNMRRASRSGHHALPLQAMRDLLWSRFSTLPHSRSRQ
jgi:hypothetical protein